MGLQDGIKGEEYEEQPQAVHLLLDGKIGIKRKAYEEPVNHITIHQKGDVVYLTFPLLEQVEGLIHGFSTRLGGVSEGDVGTMNLSFSREPSRENVLENHRRLAAAIGYAPECLVFSQQTHTTNIRVVTEKDRGVGYCRPQDRENIDGLVTNVPGTALMTFYADCVPLLLYDPVRRAIGCAHSGWRGTVAHMGRSVVEAMRREYGTRPEDLLAAIGPSICQDCYEVSADVVEQFRDAYPKKIRPSLYYRRVGGKNQLNSGNASHNLSQEIDAGGKDQLNLRNASHHFSQEIDASEKYQLNLWEACRQNFLSAGLRPEHISLPDICTCCNPQLLYSHRASHGKRGNLAAVIMLQ